MSKIIPPKVFPAGIPADRFAQNGDLPNFSGLRRVANAYNVVAGRRKRIIHSAALDFNAVATMATGDQPALSFNFRTSENITSVAMIVGVAPGTSDAGAGNPGSVQLHITDGLGGGPFTSAHVYNGNVNSGAPVPQDIVWGFAEITTAVLSPNTEYHGWINQWFFARVVAACVYEIGPDVAVSTVDGVADSLPWQVNSPILDINVQDLAETGTKLWRHNAAMMISFSQIDEASGPQVTGTTAVNVLDVGVTAWATTSPGYVLENLLHKTEKAEIPVTVGVTAVRISGSGTLTVTIIRNGGTVLTATGIATGTSLKNTSTHTITARTGDKVDVMIAAGTAGAVWRVEAVNLWEYET